MKLLVFGIYSHVRFHYNNTICSFSRLFVGHYLFKGYSIQLDSCQKFRDRNPPLTSGGRLNKKDGLSRYGDSHVKDKTS